MSDTTLDQELFNVVQTLNREQKEHLLEVARNLALPKGEPGWKIIQHARELGFSHEDVVEMEQAIEEWCELSS
jgi:hypothetical protein